MANPPRVIDQVVVGDGPEGLAVSPTGGYAASLILNEVNAERVGGSGRKMKAGAGVNPKGTACAAEG